MAMIRTLRTVLLAGAAGWSILSGGVGLHAQSHAKPAFRFVPAAETIRQYWNDAPNQFKSVRGVAPHDSEPLGLYSTARYDLLVVPQGAPVWDEFGEHPLVSEKRGRGELRGGMPQLDLALTVAAVRGRAAAEKLFNELKATVVALPSAQPRGDQYQWQVSVGIKTRPGRRSMTLSLADEPEEGVYLIDLIVDSNRDDPLWDGGGA